MPREPDYTRPRETTPEMRSYELSKDELRTAVRDYLAKNGVAVPPSAYVCVREPDGAAFGYPRKDFSGVTLTVKIP